MQPAPTIDPPTYPQTLDGITQNNSAVKYIASSGRIQSRPGHPMNLAVYSTAEALRRGEKRAEDHLCWTDHIITCIRNCDDVFSHVPISGRKPVGRLKTWPHNCRRLRETGFYLAGCGKVTRHSTGTRPAGCLCPGHGPGSLKSGPI